MVHQVPGDRFAASDLPAGRVPVLFTADWCGFCHRFLHHFKRLREGWVVDVSDDDVPAWDAFGIRVVPTVILFEDGAPVRRWAGVLSGHHVEQVREAMEGGAGAGPDAAPA